MSNSSNNSPHEYSTDVLVVGGGLGGVAAALSAARMGASVVLTEESEWLGGQLTTQAVPMDEHPWMDRFGCTASYRSLREGIRDYYRRAFPLTAAARAAPELTPGAALTTRLPCEPRIALSVIEELLAPYRATERIIVLTRLEPVSVDRDGDDLRGVEFRDREQERRIQVTARYVLDATEAGDLLPLAGMDHVTGAESQADTGEPHALAGNAEPLTMQAFTYCFALTYRDGENHTIERPRDYDFWRSYRAAFETGLHLSWNPRQRRAYRYTLFPPEERAEPGGAADGAGHPTANEPSASSACFSLWQFRRILYRGNFEADFVTGEVSVINSSHNDYWLGPIVGVSPEEAERNREAAMQLSLSTLYWLQTEAERPDGGAGYPGLKLHSDYTGTRSGLAMRPYIREGRRILSRFRVLEEHVSLECLPDRDRAVVFDDSVGIGCYNIDLHPTTGGHDSLNIRTRPFQIPLGALLPRDVENYIAAGKNLGTTHITNGCYRLHSIEWNVGEAAGALAAYCLHRGTPPSAVRESEAELREYQSTLEQLGIELGWPDVSVGTSYYRANRDRRVPDWGRYDRTRRWGE